MSSDIRITSVSSPGACVTLTLSGDNEPLLISSETVHKHRLKEGIVLTPAQVEQLKREAELFRCDREAARLLAIRDHSVGQLMHRLRRKQLSRQAVESIAQRYKETGVLDDARFAHNAALSLVRRRPCWKAYLIAYLQKKSIDRALAEHTAEVVFSGHDQAELATAALGKRWSQFSQFELEVARRKAYNYLVRRGFGYQAAVAAFDRLWEEKQKEL